MVVDPCGELAQVQACAAAYGVPVFNTSFGTVDPEGSVDGFSSTQYYVNTATKERWKFEGTPGDNTGWEKLCGWTL